MRNCPHCLNTAVIEDGYCGHCRQCTLAPLSRVPDVMRLSNDTKIRFRNAYHAVHAHSDDCYDCALYLLAGDGDLCDMGKDLIARELAFADTAPAL